MKCIICNANAVMRYEKATHQFRGDEFSINQHFFQCVDCKEEFTTTHIDQLNITQVHNQYREKYNILFPDAIKAIREKYELSAIKMSEILGFGVNSYRNYENGEIPSLANAKLISLAEDVVIFKSILEGNGNTLKPKEFEALLKIIDSLAEKQKEYYLVHMLLNFTNNEPNEYTGYKRPNIDKVKNVLLFFLKHIKKDFADKIKLNKLFFYSDFLHYKNHGYSITGLEYRAIAHGPVPSNYDFLYSNLEHIAVIESRFEKTAKGGALQLFEPTSQCNEEAFSESEINTIGKIIEKFGETPSWDLVNLSHSEKAWIELNKQKELISYQKYGFELNAI